MYFATQNLLTAFYSIFEAVKSLLTLIKQCTFVFDFVIIFVGVIVQATLISIFFISINVLERNNQAPIFHKDKIISKTIHLRFYKCLI